MLRKHVSKLKSWSRPLLCLTCIKNDMPHEWKPTTTLTKNDMPNIAYMNVMRNSRRPMLKNGRLCFVHTFAGGDFIPVYCLRGGRLFMGRFYNATPASRRVYKASDFARGSVLALASQSEYMPLPPCESLRVYDLFSPETDVEQWWRE